MLVVNKLREAVDEWRDSRLRGRVRDNTQALHWWFEEAKSEGFRPYWGQREAIETIAFLVEVEQSRDAMSLIDTYQDVPDPNLIDAGDRLPDDDRRRAPGSPAPRRRRASTRSTCRTRGLRGSPLKMATGTGKTLVMALTTVWSYFHARRESGLAAVVELPDPRAERHRLRASADGLRERLRLPRAAADPARLALRPAGDPSRREHGAGRVPGISS